MTETSPISGSESDLLLARLVEEYGERRKAGESPDIEDYVARLPERADEVRDYLSTIETLERAEPGSGDPSAAGVQVAQLGQYRIERELGRGGMGVVFLATDEQLGRRVALKLLPVQATLDPRFLRRFEREARAAARLTHPNIVPVYGVGEHASLHYYAMQYIEGHALDHLVRTLRDWSEAAPGKRKDPSSLETMAGDLLRRQLASDSSDPPRSDEETDPGELGRALRGPTYYRNVARIGVQVAEALAYAHSHGILHRDIKPSNLLMDADGRVWVTDFGLCTTTEADQLTVTSDLVGTLRYMAPEQIAGRGDARSDEYGLGITLYELLTLRPAFPGRDRAALIAKVTTEQPTRPCRVAPSIPPDLEAIVLKSTAKLPEERYGSTEALAQDLQAFLEGRPIAARPPSALHLLKLAIRRNRVLAGTIVAALVVLAVATGFYVDGLREAGEVQDRNLYQASIAAAAAATTNPETARKYLDRAPVHLRNWEWEQLDASLDSSLGTWPGLEKRITCMDLSPDGRFLCLGYDGLLVRELVEPGRDRALGTPLIEALDVRADGEEVALACRNSLRTVSLAGEPKLSTEVALPQWASSVLYHPDGESLLVGTRTGRILCYGPRLESLRFALPSGHGDWVKEMAVTADGGTLVSASWDGSIRAHDLETHESRLLAGRGEKIQSLDLDPAGRLVATGDWTGNVQLRDLYTGRLLVTWPAHDGIVNGVCFSPDGLRLASAGADRRIRLWDPVALRPLDTLAGHDASVRGVAFLADGRLVSASETGTMKTWYPEAVGGGVSLLGHVADLWSVGFDASGERLVSTSRDGTVRVWDTWTGRPLRVFVHAMPAAAVFSPDARSVLAGYKDGALRMWDIETGEATWTHQPAEGERDEDIRPRFDPGGQRFYTAARGRGVDAWEQREHEWVRVASQALPNASTAVLSRSGRYLAVGCWDGTCILYATDGLQRLWQSPRLEEGLVRASFSPDEGLLATGGWSGVVTLWSIPDGRKVREIQVEPGMTRYASTIWGLDFNHDGTRLACATEGLGMSLWDPRTGLQVARLRGRDRGHMRAVFSPDGRCLASASWSGLIRLWDTTSAQERYEHIQKTPADPRALEARRRGSFAGLHAIALEHLRREDRTAEDLSQAYSLAYGLIKEKADPRAHAVYGEAFYRYENLPSAEPELVAAAEGSELAGNPLFDAYVFLAMIQARHRNTDVAIEYLDRAFELADPNDEGHTRLLAEAQALVDPLLE